MSAEVIRDNYRKQGAQAERERIIKLLEMPNGWHETVYVAEEGDRHFEKSCITCLNIALIKGENKDYPLDLPPKTKANTETALLSRPIKFKGENK